MYRSFLLEAPYFKEKKNHGSGIDQVVSFYKFTNSHILEAHGFY